MSASSELPLGGGTRRRVWVGALAGLAVIALALGLGASRAGAAWTGYSDGNDNVAAGPSPFGALNGGHFNAVLGSFMMPATSTGNRNIASGNEALHLQTTGADNVASGYGALNQKTTRAPKRAGGRHAGAAS